jgi:competence protein ComEC
MVVAVKGLLSRPPAEKNPGEFSLRQHYEANGIAMIMQAYGNDRVAVLDSSSGWWLLRDVVFPVRRYVLHFIDSTIPGEDGAFLKGILIGERSGMTQETREAFTNSGVAHVLAVSGSNVAVVAAAVFFFLGFFRLPRWVHLPATGLGLILYMLLAANQPPVVRATVMALVFLLGRTIEAKSNPYNAIGIAALIILAYDTLQVFDVGFQLSFTAVLSILYFYPKVNSWIGLLGLHRGFLWMLRACALSLVATLGTLPLTAIYFSRVSVVGTLANVVVVPAVGFSTLLGIVSIVASLASGWVGGVYAGLNQVLLHWTILIAKAAGGLSFSYVDTHRFTLIDALPFYVALTFLFHIDVKPVARKLLILLLVTLNVAVVVPPPAAYAASSGKLRISFIDVGQGDAVFVEFPDGGTMLVDAGPRSLRYDAGERIVSPFLKRRGISRLGLVVASHPHADHIGGMSSVLRHFTVAKMVDSGQPVSSEMYEDYLAHIRAEGCSFEPARGGSIVKDFAGVRLYVLSPHTADAGHDTVNTTVNLNNASVVFKLQYGGISCILPGDSEREVELQMLDLYGDFLRSTILKVGHHGSLTSSTQEFLNAVRPEHAVVSVGTNNKFRHPSPEVIRRLHGMNVEVSRTDEVGAVIFETDGFTLSRLDWR